MFRSLLKRNIADTKRANYYGIKSLTYFIPAPPERKKGYQEKEFDAIFEFVMAQGFDLIETKLQCLGERGMWVLCILGAPDESTYNKDLDLDGTQLLNLKAGAIVLDPAIEHENF